MSVRTGVVAAACFLTIASEVIWAQYPSSKIELLAQIPIPATKYDAWGWTDEVTGIEYAMIGSDFGVYFYDLTDPYQPDFRGRWLTNGFDFKVYDHYAYSVRDVLDLTVLRGLTAPRDFVSDASYFPSGFHNVFVNEDTGFLYGSCPSLQIYDLSTPLAPQFVGNTIGSCHDAMSTIYHGPDARYVGREILFGSQASGLRIYDVTDKDNLTQLSFNFYSGMTYTHQGWPSEDHRFFFVNDELDTNQPGTRTHVFDIQDLEAPDYLGYYAGPTHATDHNLYVKGDLLYMANYTAGVRVVQLHDPGTLDMEEIAFLDTYPANDWGGYGQGAFTVYPFLDSGLLIASDMQNGLFVMRLELGNDADFDDDGVINCNDVDALVAVVASGSSNASYDLTNDGLADARDLDAWRVMAGEALFGLGAEVLPGDANLDGTVNGQDFVAWNDHKFTETPSWCAGDFNGDGFVNGPDFVIWNDHKFTASDGLQIPESTGSTYLFALMLWGGAARVSSSQRLRPDHSHEVHTA